MDHITPKIQIEDHGLYTIETNIQSLVEQIFTIEPMQEFSLGLELESDLEGASPEEQARTIFEILASILMKGVKVKYGNDTDPRRLTPNQIDVLKRHFQSFGWTFKIETTSIETDESDEYRGDYTPGNIEWYRIRLPDQEYEVKHDIIFTHHKSDFSGRVYNV